MADINDFNKYRRMSVEYSSTSKGMDMLNVGETPQQQLRRGSMPHILYGGSKNIWNSDDDQWKAVGSPPRRPSLSGTLGYTVNNNNSILSQNLRNNGVPSIIKEDTSENMSSLLTANANNKGVSIPQNLSGQWDSLASSWSGGSSIWKSNYPNTAGLGQTSNLLNNSTTSRNDPFPSFGNSNSGIQPPAPRQYRSFSVSVGALGPMNDNFGNYSSSNAAAAAAALTSQFPLSEKEEIENDRLNRLKLNENRIDEADEVNGDLDMLSELMNSNKTSGLSGLDGFGNTKIRSRSKSSSDTFGVMSNYNMNNTVQNHQRYHSQKNFNNYVMGSSKNNLSSAFLNNNNMDLFTSVLNNNSSNTTSGTDLQSKNSLLSPLITNNNDGSSIITTSSMTPTSQLNSSNNFMLSANDTSTMNASSLLTTPTTSSTIPSSSITTSSSILAQQQQQQQNMNKLMFSNVNIPSTLADTNIMNMNDMAQTNVNNTNSGMNNVNMLSNQWTNNTGITSTTSSPFRNTTENQSLAHKRSNTQPAYPMWNNNNSGNNGQLNNNDQGFSNQNNFMPGMNMPNQQQNQQNQNMNQINGNMMQGNDFMNNNNRMQQVQNNAQQRNRFYNNMFNGNQNGMNQPMYQPTFDQNFTGHNDMDFMMQQQFSMRRNSDMSMNTMMPGMYQNMPMGMNMNMNMGMNNNGMNNMMMQPYNRGHGMMMMNGDNMYINDINDYFENTEYRTRAWVEAGKNLHQMQQNVYHWPLYVIEFKAGRTDYFYVPENSGLTIKIGDLVIVEADRGKDLGKVIVNNIKNLAQLVAYHAERGNPRHLIIDDDMNNNNVPNIPITWPKGQNGEGDNDSGKAEAKKADDTTTDLDKEKTEKDEEKKEEDSSGNKDASKEEDKEGKEKSEEDKKTEDEKVNEENLQFPKDIHPKRIYRMAQPAEVNMLVQKNTDENSSMLLCQQKVRQRNMPMEVVDAEYQWDRRKLTFYFVSERRIDFRELVRDLFKVYKTRIWMCAVSSLTTMKAYQAFNINIVSPSNMNEQTIAQLQNMTIEDKKEEDATATATSEATAEKKEDGESKDEETKENIDKKEEVKEETSTITVADKPEIKDVTLDAVNTNASKVPVQTPTPPPSLPPSQVQTPK